MNNHLVMKKKKTKQKCDSCLIKFCVALLTIIDFVFIPWLKK